MRLMRQVIVSHENEGDREGRWVSSVTEGSVLGGRWCQAQMGTLSGGRGAGLRESDAFDWDRTVTVISVHQGQPTPGPESLGSPVGDLRRVTHL